MTHPRTLMRLHLIVFLLSLLPLVGAASAQDINATVSPNSGGSDNSVDIRNNSATTRWHFYSAPSPSPATMSKMNSGLTAEYPWGSPGNFAPDPTSQVQNRLFPGEYLRVYPKTLAVGTVITIPFSYGPNSGPTNNFRITVTSGVPVVSINIIDPNPTSAALVRWRVTFGSGVSGVTAANFAFSNPANITGVSIASIVADSAQPSTSWTISANTGTGNGLLGLNWVGSATESPPVPNSFTGQLYDFQFAPVISDDPDSVGINRNTTTTLTVVASLRGGGSPSYQWYRGTSVNPGAATLISGANASTYTPPVFTVVGAFQYFCRVSAGSYNTDSATATVTVVDPPQITTHPASQIGYIGQTVTLSVAATGTSLNYQWYRGTAPSTTNPVGTNSPSFTTPTLSTDISYWVRVTNPGPTIANSNTAAITVIEAPSLVVTTVNDVVNNLDNQTSLREAVTYATSLGGAQTVTFAPALAGQTVLLTNQWSPTVTHSALSITTNVTVQGLTTAPGVTLAIPSGTARRHFHVPTGGTLTLQHLTLTGGTGDYGGAVWSLGSLTVRNCLFTGNSATLEGGAIQSWGDSLLCLIENSTFSGNSTLGIASAIDAGAISMTLRHLTIAGNTADGANAADARALVFWKNQALLQNCIVGANNNSDGIGLTSGAVLMAASAGNLIGPGGSGGLVNGVNGNYTGLSGGSLGLRNLADNGGPTRTHALFFTSPAINAGIAAAPVSPDQRGALRRTLAVGGLIARFYAVPPASAGPTLLSPISNLEALAPALTMLVPALDFGSGTETAAGNGSVLDRAGTTGNPFGGIGVNAGVDNIAVLADGFINIPEAGDYRFTTRSDDGSVLYLDGAVIVNNNNLQPMTNVSSALLRLSPGLHSIRAAYFEATGGAGFQVSWERVGGASPFARTIIPASSFHSGSVPDSGAFEDGLGEDDPDFDSLSNLSELLGGSSATALDTDSDGFNDATEIMAGTNPASGAATPPTTRIERVLGFGPARGLDLSGNFIHAANVGTNGAPGTAGAANFTADTAPGITVTAQQQIAQWSNPVFGNTPEDDVLENVFRSIRWTDTTTAQTLNATLANLVPGRNYKLQLLFGEGGTFNRRFDVTAGGTLLADDFRPADAQGSTSVRRAGSAIVHEFNAAGTTLPIVLSGLSVPALIGLDRNPILNGLTLEELPTPAAVPVFTPASGTYAGGVTVSFLTPSVGASIRYTTDGSPPSGTNGLVYSAPFLVAQNMTIRAIALGGGWLDSPIASASYTVTSALQAWRNLHGLPQDGSLDEAVPAADGVPNLQKYAFNLAPGAGQISIPNRLQMVPGGASGLPSITRNSLGLLRFEFMRRKASTLPGLAWVPESGNALGDFTPLDLTGAVVTSVDATWERVLVVDPTATARRFGRVTLLSWNPYANDFNTGPGAVSLRGTAVHNGSAIMLTDTVNGQLGTAVFNAPVTHPAMLGFTARFIAAMGPGSLPPADGMQFAAGDLGTGAWGESGPGTTRYLGVSFDTYENGPANGSVGIHVMVNGTRIASSTVNPYTNGVPTPVEIVFDAGDGITVRYNNAIIFDRIPVPGFVFPVNGRFGIGARTGGLNQRTIIDDVFIAPR